MLMSWFLRFEGYLIMLHFSAYCKIKAHTHFTIISTLAHILTIGKKRHILTIGKKRFFWPSFSLKSWFLAHLQLEISISGPSLSVFSTRFSCKKGLKLSFLCITAEHNYLGNALLQNVIHCIIAGSAAGW